MFDGVVELRGAVIGIDRAVGPRSAVGRADAQFDVFLVVFPRNAGRVQLGGKVDGLVVERIAIGGEGVRIGVDPKIRPSFGPDIIGLGRMDADAGIVIGRGKRNLRRVRVARRDKAVEIRRGRIAENLLRARTSGWAG